MNERGSDRGAEGYPDDPRKRNMQYGTGVYRRRVALQAVDGEAYGGNARFQRQS